MASASITPKTAKKAKQIPVDLQAFPHNGRHGYQQEVTFLRPRVIDGVVRTVRTRAEFGGQRLLIAKAVTAKTMTAPVGRRFGKSTSFPFLINEEHSDWIGLYRAIYFAQDHTKAKEMLELLLDFFGGDPAINKTSMVKSFHRSEDQNRWIEIRPIDRPDTPQLCTGIKVWCLSGQHPHYEKARGFMFPINRVVIDEASLMHERILNVVNPMLADAGKNVMGIPGGRMLIVGTPLRGGVGQAWFEIFYNRGQSQEPRYAKFDSMNFPSEANPILEDEALEDLRNNCLTPQALKEEYYAQFLTDEGAVFQNLNEVFTLEPMKDLPKWVTSKVAQVQATGMKAWIHSEPDPLHHYIVSADWAIISDRTIITVYDMTSLEQAAIFSFHGDQFTEQQEWASYITRVYRASTFHSDENTGAGQMIGTFLRREKRVSVFGHKFNTYNKGEYVARAQAIFYEARFKLIKIPGQFAEFKQYRIVPPDTSKGEVRVRYSHPPGGTDDYVDVFLQASEDIIDGQRAARTERIKPNNKIITDDGKLDPMAADPEIRKLVERRMKRQADSERGDGPARP